MSNIEPHSETTNLHAVELFQRFLGKKFPKDFVEFLVTYNGGAPSVGKFCFKDSDGGSSVRYFHGIRKKADSDDLLRNIEVYKERVPSDFVPIASDYGGNKIMLAVSGPMYGQVFFWDHENEADEGQMPTMQNMTLVSKNFTLFVASLTD